MGLKTSTIKTEEDRAAAVKRMGELDALHLLTKHEK